MSGDGLSDLEKARLQRQKMGIYAEPESLDALRYRREMEAKQRGDELAGWVPANRDDKYSQKVKAATDRRKKLAAEELAQRRQANGWPGRPVSLSEDVCGRCAAETENGGADYALCDECDRWVGKKQREQFRLSGGLLMKRPAWAASPNFANCWAAVEALRAVPDASGQADLILELLSRAHVVSIEPEQAEQLPRIEDSQNERRSEMIEAWQALSLPFDRVFLDLGGVGNKYGEGVAGVLLWPVPGIGSSFAIYPFVKGRDGTVSGAVASLVCGSEDDGPVEIMVGDTFGMADRLGEEWLNERVHFLHHAAEVVVAVLTWLESVNVEIAETPMKPQARERQISKGRKIALTVAVKQSKRYIASSSDNRANYTHRFEIRGHYKHHFPEKPNGEPNKTFERYAAKHPEKVLTIQGQPCVRFWTPPFVKGPVDKPLVPKIRVVQENNGN